MKEKLPAYLRAVQLINRAINFPDEEERLGSLFTAHIKIRGFEMEQREIDRLALKCYYVSTIDAYRKGWNRGLQIIFENTRVSNEAALLALNSESYHRAYMLLKRQISTGAIDNNALAIDGAATEDAPYLTLFDDAIILPPGQRLRAFKILAVIGVTANSYTLELALIERLEPLLILLLMRSGAVVNESHIEVCNTFGCTPDVRRILIQQLATER